MKLLLAIGILSLAVLAGCVQQNTTTTIQNTATTFGTSTTSIESDFQMIEREALQLQGNCNYSQPYS